MLFYPYTPRSARFPNINTILSLIFTCQTMPLIHNILFVAFPLVPCCVNKAILRPTIFFSPQSRQHGRYFDSCFSHYLYVRSICLLFRRQVREGVEIVRAEADLLLNSKLDHFQQENFNLNVLSIRLLLG